MKDFVVSLLLGAATFFVGLTPGLADVVPWTIAINTNNIITVTNSPYNAVGDGVATNTTAIQNAINAATLGGNTNGLWGGVVRIPAGIFLSGPLNMKNNVNLQVDAGGILRMLPFGAYPVTWFTNGGTNIYFVNSGDFISGSSLTNIAISGPGAIDGQGLPWWPWANTNLADRPVMISLSGCNHELIQNITLSNSPMFHIAIGGSAGNTTVQGVTIRAPSSGANPPSHNTDACDVKGTNILVRDCDISVGDDNFTCGGNTSDILITNCTYGNGHGVSIGSYTSPYVSNMTVINCSFTGTDQGIRIKTDRDRGGFVHNINYYNLSMTNVMRAILIYCQYTNTVSAYRAVDSISPGVAASYPAAAVTGTTPHFRDITISNLTGTTQSGRAAGLIWGLPESSISNLTLAKISISSQKTFGIYCAKNVRLIDCTNTILASGTPQYSFFDSQVIFSNTVTPAAMVTLDGVTTNGIANDFSFFNFLPTLKSTNAVSVDSFVTLNNSTFTISNNLALTVSNVITFALGTNAATLAVKGNLVLGGSNNFLAGPGFTNGTYTLMTYTGTLGGSTPTVGAGPAGYAYAINTATAGQVKVSVTATVPPPAAPTNLVAIASNSLITLTWSPAATATNYNVKRSNTSGSGYLTIATASGTNYADPAVANGVTYYYVVSAINAGGESANSTQASATPPVPILFSDLFNSSTLNSASPATPVSNGTSYEMLSSKTWSPSPSLSAGHFVFGIAATSSGSVEAQALFASNPVVLASIGDTLTLTIAFTNTAGLLTSNCVLGVGMYRSGGNFPVPGGLNGTATTTGGSGNAIGNAQNWIGYVGQLAFTGSSSQIVTRQAQSGTANNNQDLVTSGSSSSSYANPAAGTVGSASTAPSLALTAGNPYTEVLTFRLAATNQLAITNQLYAGTNTNGALLSQFGAVASGGNFLTNSFDALAIGWRETASQTTTIDINKITLTAALAANTPVPPAAPTNFTAVGTNLQVRLKWNAVSGVNNYFLKRGNVSGGPFPTVINTSATNYTDADVTNAVTYYYVVTAFNNVGESTNSAQASAAPLPSNLATNLVSSFDGTQLLLSWPSSHLGWRLQIQTNDVSAGLSTNWSTVPNSTTVNSVVVPVDNLNGSVFLRLVYP